MSLTLTEVSKRLRYSQPAIKKIEKILNLSLGSSGHRGVPCEYTESDVEFIRMVKTLRGIDLSFDEIKFLYTAEMRIYRSPEYKHNTPLIFGSFLTRQNRKPQMPVMTTTSLESDMTTHEILRNEIRDKAECMKKSTELLMDILDRRIAV